MADPLRLGALGVCLEVRSGCAMDERSCMSTLFMFRNGSLKCSGTTESAVTYYLVRGKEQKGCIFVPYHESELYI